MLALRLCTTDIKTPICRYTSVSDRHLITTDKSKYTLSTLIPLDFAVFISFSFLQCFHLPMLKGQLQLFFHRKLSVLSSKTTFPVTLKMHSEKRMTVKAAEPLEARACQCALHLCVRNVQLFTRVQHSWQ